MTLRTKMIGLVVIALVAINAVAATTAHAAPEFQTVETKGGEEITDVPATLNATTVEGEPIRLTLGGMPIGCPSATATSTLESESSSTLTLSPNFGSCKALLFFPAEVKVGSCKYVLHATEEVEADIYAAHADIACPEGEILITIRNMAKTKTKCLIHVPSQTGLTSVKVKDMTEASPDDVTLTNEIETVKAVVTEGEESCLITPGTYTNGKLTGSTTAVATGGGETPPIDYSLIPSRRFHFALEEEEVTIVGTPDTSQTFFFNLGFVNCISVLLETVTPPKAMSVTEFSGGESYEECLLEKVEPTEIKMNGCKYKFAAWKTEFGQRYGRLSVVCPPGETMEVKIPECTIEIPSQGPLSKVRLENLETGAQRTVTAELIVTGVTYEEVGAECAGNGKKTNGYFTGSWRFKSRNAAFEQRGFWTVTTP